MAVRDNIQFNKFINRRIKASRRSFISNTLVLVGGNFFAQVFAIGLMPIITRLYSPDSLGIFFIITAISGIIAPISSLRYDMAILLPKKEEDSYAIALLSFFIVFIISTILLSTVLLAGKDIAIRLNIQQAATFLYIIPIFILLRGINNLLAPLLLRAKLFKFLAFSKIALTCTDKTTSIGLGLSGLVGPGGLILARTFGLIVQLFIVTGCRGIQGIKIIFSLSSINRLTIVAKRYKNFPKYLWSALLQRLSMQLPVLLFGAIFSPIAAGYFALSKRILHEPIEIVGDALARSYFQKSSELQRNGQELARISERLFYIIATIGSLPLLLIGTIGADLFGYVFGTSWQEAGLYTQILAPIYIATFLFRPISKLFDVLEKQKEAFTFNCLFLAMSVISLIPGGLLGRPLLGVSLFSLSTTIMFTSRIVWLLAQIGIKPKKTLSELGRCTFRAVLFASPVIILKYYFKSDPIVTICSAGLLSILYIFYLFLVDNNIREEISHIKRTSFDM